MPIEQTSTFSPIRALTIAFLGIAMAIGCTVLIQRLVAADAVEVKLGDDIFKAGSADNLSMVIDRDGVPILFQALVGDRDIYLQHLGEDPELGWSAFDARRPGTSRECNLAWQPGGFFRDPCEEGADFDAGGTGLPQYGISVDDGVVYIDLNGVNESTEG